MKLSEIQDRLSAIAKDKSRDIPYPSITIEVAKDEIEINAWDGHELFAAKSIAEALNWIENLRVKPDDNVED